MTSVTPARAEVQELIDIAKEHSAKKKRDAHKRWRAASERSRELLGANHDATLYCQSNVGKSLIDIGSHEEAIPILETTLRQVQAINGYAHFSVEHICQSLARAYKAKGEVALSHKYWMSAASSSQTLRGLHHRTTIYCLHQAGRALTSVKRFEEALALLRKVLDANITVHGDSLETGYSARDTATCLNQLDRFEEALPLWKRAHRIFERAEGKEDIAETVYRCMDWTRDKVRTRARAEQLTLLAAVDGLTAEDARYLADARLSHKQLGAVLDHLKKTYLLGDDSNYQYADTLRVAVKSRPTQVLAYRKQALTGCCGSEDVELQVIEDNGNKTKVMVGFNFGH